ncbi:Nin one binding Zn-ribbon like-domain-containing protein [Polychytrium aggregatum]|uniref:Nin one binding Zn-ribbon like-domain-containing protein n=1 Tax=Polychytrium aggregatum TaxID=110093 RepID=UPI0022FEDB4C|nr:Nin one binding Zn-ribbon like-domain-containing protein [Polychytrium aggregatum]KAI9209857.1 Nin one binding Zn-ribbon like-domain-containing protein [Polychytrium aggregatum]
MSTSISPDPFPSRDVQHEISRGHDRVDTLVVDAAPLIKGNRLEHLASNFVTIPEVLGEIRDRQARSAMATLPFELKVRAPSEEAMKHVIAFSKKTGDFATLSITDLKILALTYMLEREAKGVSHLRTEPLRSEAPHERLGSNDDAVSTPGSDAPKTKRRRHRGKKQPQEDKPIHLNLPDRTISKNKRSQPMDEVPSLDEDDGGEWITPANISKFKAQNSGLHADHEREPENIPVACITSDFAMQNVLLQMGLRLISVDGFAITHIKNWVLRCHACFKSTKDMERRFCPTCGNNTLIRTSVSVDANGNTIYHLKKNFQYRTRGTIWSIPEPKGGRRNTDVVLREDQREYQRALQYQKRQKQGSEDINDPDAAMFGAGQKNLMKNSQQLGTLTIGSGRRNPNERRRRR